MLISIYRLWVLKEFELFNGFKEIGDDIKSFIKGCFVNTSQSSYESRHTISTKNNKRGHSNSFSNLILLSFKIFVFEEWFFKNMCKVATD